MFRSHVSLNVRRTRSAVRFRFFASAPIALIAILSMAGPLAGVSAARTASPMLASIVPSCVASQLSARIVDWQGAAGSRIADVELVNTSFVHCSLRDLPRVRLVSSSGAVLINGIAASTTAHTHGLVPLATIKTEVSANNYCGPAVAGLVTLSFTLPGSAGRIVAIPASEPGAGAVPPCLGAPGSAGHIEMHAWHF
jgi:uncharacterized protein DUF4232